MLAGDQQIETRQRRPCWHEDVRGAFAQYLSEAFDMPVHQALDLVNRKLAANPLTSDIQLTLEEEPARP